MDKIWLALFVVLGIGSAHAGECKISITRTACPGKQDESYKKCNGAQSCDSKQSTASAAACAQAALKACENIGDRQKVTKSKVVTATYDAQPVDGGKNFCDAARPDFNKCK